MNIELRNISPILVRTTPYRSCDILIVKLFKILQSCITILFAMTIKRNRDLVSLFSIYNLIKPKICREINKLEGRIREIYMNLLCCKLEIEFDREDSPNKEELINTIIHDVKNELRNRRFVFQDGKRVKCSQHVNNNFIKECTTHLEKKYDQLMNRQIVYPSVSVIETYQTLQDEKMPLMERSLELEEFLSQPLSRVFLPISRQAIPVLGHFSERWFSQRE